MLCSLVGATRYYTISNLNASLFFKKNVVFLYEMVACVA